MEWIEGPKRRAEVADRLKGKLSKEEANYRPQQNVEDKSSCRECEHYLDPEESSSLCRRVAGSVEADDICDLWVARTEDHSAQPQVTIQIRS